MSRPVALAPPPPPCRVGRRALEVLVDREGGEEAWALAAHARRCPLCTARLRELWALEAAASELGHLRRQGLDPLAAMGAIARSPRRPMGLVARVRARLIWAWTFRPGWCCLLALWAALVAVGLGSGDLKVGRIGGQHRPAG